MGLITRAKRNSPSRLVAPRLGAALAAAVADAHARAAGPLGAALLTALTLGSTHCCLSKGWIEHKTTRKPRKRAKLELFWQNTGARHWLQRETRCVNRQTRTAEPNRTQSRNQSSKPTRGTNKPNRGSLLFLPEGTSKQRRPSETK